MANFKKENNPNWRGGKSVPCEVCGSLHYRVPARLKIGNHKYCSRKCHKIGQSLFPNKPKKGSLKFCPLCNKSYYISKCFQRRKYCSIQCANEGMKKRVFKNCAFCNKETEYRISTIVHGGGKFCSKKCQDAFAETITGEKSPCWKGGRTKKNRRIRGSAKFARWRKKVFERDNYTCQNCGDRSGKGNAVELHPHHIKTFAKYPKLRFDVSNGITVCKGCHKNIHDKLRKKNKIYRSAQIKLFDCENGKIPKEQQKVIHKAFMEEH